VRRGGKGRGGEGGRGEGVEGGRKGGREGDVKKGREGTELKEDKETCEKKRVSREGEIQALNEHSSWYNLDSVQQL